MSSGLTPARTRRTDIGLSCSGRFLLRLRRQNHRDDTGTEKRNDRKHGSKTSVGNVGRKIAVTSCLVGDSDLRCRKGS